MGNRIKVILAPKEREFPFPFHWKRKERTEQAMGPRKRPKTKINTKSKTKDEERFRNSPHDAEDQPIPKTHTSEVGHVLQRAGGLIENGAGDEGEIPFSRSYFNARESTKKCYKKVSDIDLVEEEDLRAALVKIIPKHEKEVSILLDSYKTLYKKWHFQLSCGFGLLMYGFGSKKALLEDFASSALMDGAAVVIRGYLPTINMKTVVYTIADALFQQRKATRKVASKVEKSIEDGPSTTKSLDELMGYLNMDDKEGFIYVIVHNIDGPGLRDGDVQEILANLAACSQVRFVASVDHINAPLLWDKCMANTKFNWWWHHVPTYSSYNSEAMFLPLLLASAGAAKNAKSALIVLQSLTPNAQSVFRTLAEYQLGHTEEQGLSIHKLYTLCREKFLVSSELTLRAHLTEFKDHELIRLKRGFDGQDQLFVPLPSETLSKLLEDFTN